MIDRRDDGSVMVPNGNENEKGGVKPLLYEFDTVELVDRDYDLL
jgi:hypothetical protein